MISQIPADQFLKEAKNKPIIDVRSPGEFDQGHIPGAVNIPLFTNEERAKVGTKYKHVNKESALLLGLDIVGPKMSGFVRQAQKVATNSEVLVHCWRGGMRSGSFAWLLNTAGLKVGTLQKGYKAYRNEVLRFFEQPLPLLILTGKTGSGKTDILKEIAQRGEQVIDLEALAHHKGSTFGSLGQATQPTTEQFENNLHQALSGLDLSKRIWLEDESICIGTVHLPLPLWQQIRQAPVISIEVPKERRIERLVKEYGGFKAELLESSIVRIRKRMGGLHFQQALEALDAGDYQKVADLALVYYDKAYLFGLAKREAQTIHPLALEKDDPADSAGQVIALANNIFQPA